ncbi:MAG: hypothetical protein J6386_19025 [Candidatus Synoicihabitans palmerolidicus]|nr:hypothetical protein [Candidatus Synoicihabitans palmerolidicus]
MCYIVKANLALSVTATAVATMLAPLMTPLWMKLLAGELVEVSFLGMMTTIIKIVVVPIGAALLHDCLKHAPECTEHKVAWAQVIGGSVAVFLFLIRDWAWRVGLSEGAGLVVELAGFVFGAIAFGASYHAATCLWPRIERGDATVVDGGYRVFYDGHDGGGERFPVGGGGRADRGGDTAQWVGVRLRLWAGAVVPSGRAIGAHRGARGGFTEWRHGLGFGGGDGETGDGGLGVGGV